MARGEEQKDQAKETSLNLESLFKCVKAVLTCLEYKVHKFNTIIIIIETGCLAGLKDKARILTKGSKKNTKMGLILILIMGHSHLQGDGHVSFVVNLNLPITPIFAAVFLYKKPSVW